MVEDLVKLGADRGVRDEEGGTLLRWALRHGWHGLVGLPHPDRPYSEDAFHDAASSALQPPYSPCKRVGTVHSR